MWSSSAPIVTALLSGGLVSGCATIPRHAGFIAVAKTVESRAGVHLEQYTGPPTGLVADTIQQLLREELSVDRALRIAVLNNRSLQATLEELGMARADVLHASLLKNPIFSGHARLPEAGGGTNLELALAQSVIDTLSLPLRRQVALAQFEQAKLKVTDAVLTLLMDVTTAYYTAQAAEQLQALRETVLEAAKAAAELARRQYEAGNIRDFDWANEQAADEQAHVELARSRADLKAAREQLNQLLGLAGPEATAWRMAPRPLELPAADPPLDELETLALFQRLDLAIVRQEANVLRRSVSVARLGVVPDADVAMNSEREPDGDRVLGPMWDVPIPIFNWGQADRARLKAQLRQTAHRLAAMEVAARAEVRTAHERMITERQVAERYHDQLIPLRQQIVESSLRHYNYMLIGAFQLLMAKQHEVTARQDYINAIRDYWIARAHLERAVGGQLPTSEGMQTKPIASPEEDKATQEVPDETPQHQHGGHP
jgi:cobalt-zinc-cadmium efflux system outer membrane protein